MTDIRDALTRFLTTDPADVGCDEAWRLVHAYAESIVADGDPEAQHQGVSVHLAACGPCGEDFDGLVAALRNGVAGGGAG